MPSSHRALLDTSIIVGDRDVLAELPELSSLSVITIGELRAGVALAATKDEQRRRSARFNAVRSAFAPIPVDEHVAIHYGDLLALARPSGRAQKATDLLIAATAAATDATLVTADRAQARLAESAGIPVTLLPLPRS